MATIEQDVAAIRTAVYGKDVREAIADGIENCYRNTTSAGQIAEIQEAADQIREDINDAAEEAIESIPQDYTALSNSVDDLRDMMDDLYVRDSINLYNPDTDRHGININGDGSIYENEVYKCSDYIFIGNASKVSYTKMPDSVATDGPQAIFYYSEARSSAFISRLYVTTNPQTFTVPANTKYIVFGMYDISKPYMVNIGDTPLPYVAYENQLGPFLQKEADKRFNIINRFNKETITPGRYIAITDGGLATNADFFASDYIDVSNLKTVTLSYTHIFGWYDEDKNWLGHPESMNTWSSDATYTVPGNAKYLRFSAYNEGLNLAQVGETVSRTNYADYGKYRMPDLLVSPEQIGHDFIGITVDKSGGGDYTSLTQALYENVNSVKTIRVLPGTYDIVAEYVDLFGQSAVNSMADSNESIFNGFQFGAIIRNKTVEFTPGAEVVCDWTGHSVDGTHRFSALRVDYNCKIIGLHLVSTGTFYAIHDDYGLSGLYYTVEYENCYVEGINLTNANCIGGGCKKYSRHILKDCYFDNHLTDSATVRYHNTNGDGSVPEIYVSNCYFNNWFTPRWYGSQTSKMKVYVNNCEARSIHKLAESSSFNVDNIELYKWHNTETDPVS